MAEVLIDFSLTVKASTLMFISGCDSAISSAKQGKSGPINLVKNKILISCLGRANVRAFHENPNRIHTELTFINMRIITKCMCFIFLLPLKYLKPYRQTVWTQIRLLL